MYMVFVPQMEGLEMYFVLLNEKLKKIKKGENLLSTTSQN